MAYSEDLRWRAVILYSFTGVSLEDVEALLGATGHSIRKWASRLSGDNLSWCTCIVIFYS